MPDANVDAVLNALVTAGFGSAVQRCTAISTAVFVGDSKSWYAPHQFNFWSYSKHSLFMIIKMKPVGGECRGRSDCP